MTARANAAGASAQREYETQRKAFIRRNRRVFAVLNVITLVVVVITVVVCLALW